MSRILAALAAIFMFSCAAIAAPPTLDQSRTYVLGGVIANGNALALADKMLAQAHDGTNMPLDLIIASPGGDVITGFLFINVMEAVKAAGTPIRCYVPTIAASMAFQILVHCDERYALDRAFLLFHRVRVSLPQGTPITAPSAREMAHDMALMDQGIYTELVNALGMDEKVIRYNFERETLWVAADLAAATNSFIQVYPAIPGVIEAALAKNIPHMPSAGGNTKSGQIIYIWRGAQR